MRLRRCNVKGGFVQATKCPSEMEQARFRRYRAITNSAITNAPASLLIVRRGDSSPMIYRMLQIVPSVARARCRARRRARLLDAHHARTLVGNAVSARTQFPSCVPNECIDDVECVCQPDFSSLDTRTDNYRTITRQSRTSRSNGRRCVVIKAARAFCQLEKRHLPSRLRAAR